MIEQYKKILSQQKAVKQLVSAQLGCSFCMNNKRITNDVDRCQARTSKCYHETHAILHFGCFEQWLSLKMECQTCKSSDLFIHNMH